MSLFSRITATLTASVDKAVGLIENHDAVIDASIRDCRAALVKARVQNARVIRDGESLRNRLHELKEMVVTWENRAKLSASRDEKKALDCLQRRNQCKQRIVDTESSLSRHIELEEKVAANIRKIEQRLAETSQQRNLMRSRQSAADATRTLNKLSSINSGDVDDVFERWEVSISEVEYEMGVEDEIDSLDSSFRELEDEEGLRAELFELIGKQEAEDNE